MGERRKAERRGVGVGVAQAVGVGRDQAGPRQAAAVDVVSVLGKELGRGGEESRRSALLLAPRPSPFSLLLLLTSSNTAST
jgi:hypothetical protein